MKKNFTKKLTLHNIFVKWPRIFIFEKIREKTRNTFLRGLFFLKNPIVMTDKHGIRFVLYPWDKTSFEKLLTHRMFDADFLGFHLVVYSEEQNVSTDLIGMDAAIVIEGQFNHTRTAFIDVDLSNVPDLPEAFLKTLSQSTIRIPVVHAKIFGWYDNEYGSYTNRLGDLTAYIHQSLFR